MGQETLGGSNQPLQNSIEALRERFANSGLPLGYLLSRAHEWDRHEMPRETFTKEPAKHFYESFYPDIEPEDGMAYGVICELDGLVWLGIQEWAKRSYESVAATGEEDRQSKRKLAETALYKVKPFIEGHSLDEAPRKYFRLAWRNSMIKQRLELGMPRGVKFFSLVLGMEVLEGSTNISLLGQLKESLGLSNEELALAQNIHQAVVLLRNKHAGA